MNARQWWFIAIVAMVVINVILWMWLGPRGGFGLFLFLPLVFGWRRADRDDVTDNNF